MITTRPKRLGFGITSRERFDLERLAARVEALGYDELWTNDTRAGSGLATLAHCAVSTRELRLCVGVMALSEHDPVSIVDRVRSLALPLSRLTVGLGSGSSTSLDLVRDGVLAVREALPGAQLAVAAMGPRMCRLAGELADVVLLNWNTPDRVAWSRERIGEGAAAAGRPAPLVAAYVRVAIGPEATGRLQREAERYMKSSDAYRRAFETQTIDLGAIGIAADAPDGVAHAVRPYREVLDTTVVRGLPVTDDVDAWIRIAEAAAPGQGRR